MGAGQQLEGHWGEREKPEEGAGDQDFNYFCPGKRKAQCSDARVPSRKWGYG